MERGPTIAFEVNARNKKTEHRQAPTSGIGTRAITNAKNRNGNINQLQKQEQEHERTPEIGT